jgi:hypothetical protein
MPDSISSLAHVLAQGVEADPGQAGALGGGHEHPPA